MTNSDNLISILKSIPHIYDPIQQITGETLVRGRLFVEGTSHCLYILSYDPELGLWLAIVELCPGIMELSYFSNLALIKFAERAQTTYLQGRPRPPSYPNLDLEWIERPLSLVFSQKSSQKGKRKIPQER